MNKYNIGDTVYHVDYERLILKTRIFEIKECVSGSVQYRVGNDYSDIWVAEYVISDNSDEPKSVAFTIIL